MRITKRQAKATSLDHAIEHPKATRDKLRALYCNGEQSLETAAALCGVSLGTARRWRDEAKAQALNLEQIRANYLRDLQNQNPAAHVHAGSDNHVRATAIAAVGGSA